MLRKTKWNEKSRIHYGKKLNWNWFYRVKKTRFWIVTGFTISISKQTKRNWKQFWNSIENHSKIMFFFSLRFFFVSFPRSETWRIFSWIIFLFGCFSGSKTNKNHHQFYLEKIIGFLQVWLFLSWKKYWKKKI